MARRGSSIILVAAIVACALYAMLPGQDAFVAPSPSTSLRAGAAPLAQGYDMEVRSVGVSLAAQTPTDNQGLTSPRKINLLFIGLAAGTAAIGLLAIFFYGAYSGTGSSL